MNRKRVLILEDDLKTIQVILGQLEGLEEYFSGKGEFIEFAVTTISEYTLVEQWLNKSKANSYDVILLDRDCILGGSFHCLDFNIYKTDKIIAISSVPAYNQELLSKGVKRVVGKDYQNLEKFGNEIKEELKTFF